MGAEVSAPIDGHLTDRELARLIRGSTLLDAVMKRQWLKLLPHLSPADRARLEEIMRSAEAPGLPDPAPKD